MIKNYLKIAWRNILRTKVYSLINISGLSIGLACCMLIILYTKDEISFDQFHKNANSIYRITNTSVSEDGKIESTHGITGMLPGPSFKAEIPEIMEFVRVQGERLPVKVGRDIFEQEALYVDDNFFTVFSFPLIAGNPASVLRDYHSVVLSEETARKLFGTSAASGRTLELPLGNDGAFEQFVVTGLVKQSPQNSSIKLYMVLPMKLRQREGGSDQVWMNFFLNTFVVLAPNTDTKAVVSKFKKVYEQKAAAEIVEAREKYGLKSSMNYGLQPLLSIHLSKDFKAANGLTDESDPMYSKILSGIALFILLIACINFINLSVARSLKRAKEIGIRKVVGGDRNQLIAQFLGESFLLSFCSFILAIILVIVTLPFFNTLANKALSFHYLFDLQLIIGYIILFIITALLAGFYPAIVLSGFNPVQTLYNRIPSLGKNYLSKGLVVLQFTLATFLIVSTITIYSQFQYLAQYKLGYDDKNLVLVNTGQMKSNKLEVLKHELKKSPGIISVAARQRGEWGTIAKADGKQLEFALDVVDTSFLSTLKLSLVKGRNLSSVFPSDSTNSVMINEAFAEKAGWNDISGKQVDFFYDSIKYNVVGVVRNYHFESLAQTVKPQLFTMNPKYSYGQLLIKIRPENSSSTLKHIEQVVKSHHPYLPYKYDFKDLNNLNQYAKEDKWKQIISFAAILTIFISCIGLFGLATLAAEKRTKEVGIRKVLGASVAGITKILSLSFLKLVFIATLFAFPAAWWAMNTWLENYPYRVEIGVSVFIYSGLIVVLIALFTVSFQAIRKAVANPIQSLRTE